MYRTTTTTTHRPRSVPDPVTGTATTMRWYRFRYHRTTGATPRHATAHAIYLRLRSVRSVGSSTGSRLKSPARTVIHKNVSTSNSSLTYVHIKITFTNKQGRVTRYCDLFVTLLPPRSVHCTVATAISITNRTYCTLIHALIALSELDLYIRSQLLRCLKDTNSASVKSLEDV